MNESVLKAHRRLQHNLSTLYAVAACLVIAAAAWFLLKELAPLLRPLFLSIFLAYVILPIHLRLKNQGRGTIFRAVVVVAVLSIFLAAALAIYASVVDFSREFPELLQRGRTLLQGARAYLIEHVPWFAGTAQEASRAEEQGADRVRQAVGSFANLAADVLLEALTVGIYLLFLLLEASHFPQRVRMGFTSEQAERLLAVVSGINDAMASYLKVKVRASLLLAIPATVVLWLCGVKFALLWGVLTFVANFIPYLGSVVACGLPILFAFLQLDWDWLRPTVAVLLVGLHMLSAYLIEPAMTGKAVNLSPLVILLALAFWGLSWGLIGMVLAVPLTVMFKIILENVAFTRPVAQLLSDTSAASVFPVS